MSSEHRTESSCSSEADNRELEGAVGGSAVNDKMNCDTLGEVENSAAGIDAACTVMSVGKDIPPPSQPADAYEKLAQERKNQIMFELRRLQLGDRPVTGQGNREVVADFFARALAPADEQTVNPEETRPEAVTVEVNALVERRPVHAVLQSAAFRRNLENALMGAIRNVNQNESRSSRRPAPSRNASEESRPSRTQLVAERPVLRPRRRVVSRHPAAAAIANHLNRRVNSGRVERYGTPSREDNAMIPPAPPLPPTGLAEQWVQQVPDPEPQLVEEERVMSTWERMEQAHRDDLIQDITELVQRQLVTSVLEGEFRPVLERNMHERLNRTGANGERVQQFIQSLPNSGIRRNDFSELGIGQIDPSISDEMSVISATAAVTVNTQQNTAMSREMRSLKSQMQELKNMMRLSFDLQLDIQRSIRQEVAAALKQALDNNRTETQGAPQPQRSTQGVANTPVNDDSCLICLEGRCDSVLYQCGHMCVCYPCGLQLRARGSNCPVCRAPIRDIIRAYRSTQNME